MLRVRNMTVLVAVAAAGCSAGGNGPTAAPASMTLRDVADLLRTCTRPPASLADLAPGQRVFPQAYQAVKAGDVVVVWGGAMKGEGDAAAGGGDVIAYEKAVPADGGQVLLTSGEVKQMSAAEFAAAPKAGAR